MSGKAESVSRRRVLGAAAALAVGPLTLFADAASGKAAGQTTRVFATDIRLSGLLHAVIARPPVLGSRLAGFDSHAALAVGGVVAAIRLAPWGESGLARSGGVAILARDTWAAHRGCDALSPVWEAGSTVAGTIGGERAHGVFVPETAEPLMEPPSATALVGDDRCAIWACLRRPDAVRGVLAGLLDLAPSAVTLHLSASAAAPGRFSNPAHAVEAALLSRAMGGVPVSLTWTRADDLPFRGSLASS